MPVQAGRKAIREWIRLQGIRTGASRHCRQLTSKGLRHAARQRSQPVTVTGESEAVRRGEILSSDHALLHGIVVDLAGHRRRCQLRLARTLAASLRLPWQRPAPGARQDRKLPPGSAP
jgi:hypothetical protein